MFCGVGPFAIPLAKRDVLVYANDLNPMSHKFLVENAELNKVAHRIVPFNLDARVFVRRMVARGIRFHHALMNLPLMAPEFLGEP